MALTSFSCIDSYKSISDSNSNGSFWSNGFDRPLTIDFQSHSCLFFTFILRTTGIYVHFSHSPINHTINFILTFLPKNAGYEINTSNHHNIFDESVLRWCSSIAHACYLYKLSMSRIIKKIRGRNQIASIFCLRN
jgi:hypothetical protein